MMLAAVVFLDAASDHDIKKGASAFIATAKTPTIPISMPSGRVRPKLIPNMKLATAEASKNPVATKAPARAMAMRLMRTPLPRTC